LTEAEALRGWGVIGATGSLRFSVLASSEHKIFFFLSRSYLLSEKSSCHRQARGSQLRCVNYWLSQPTALSCITNSRLL